jgi:argininosuccinate lyase
VFETDVYRAIDLDECVKRRTSFGGTAPQSVAAQIAAVRELIAK